MAYRGRRGMTYNLGTKIKGGGEGEVYELQGRSDLVAKIYYDSKFTPTSECSNPYEILKEKIETMLDQPVDPYMNNVLSVAWPQDILYDASGKFVGYTMPRVNSKYHIYAASRERERNALYKNYTWKVGILIAYNLALAVKKIHETGAIVGDLNPNNIMIDSKGHVTLIDTDSFNITNKQTGKVYKCSVGVPEMLPPELQGKNLAKTTSVFTKETDSFALSIHIFNLLMNNCHPFGCVGMNKSQSSSSNNPMVHNIVKGNCPYVTSGAGDKSPNAPDMMVLPTDIRALFDRAFSYNVTTAVKQSTISKRPSAEEWQNVLWSFYNESFDKCISNSSHVFPKHYAHCPWCAISTPPVSVKKLTPKPNNNSNSSYYSGTAHNNSATIKTNSNGVAMRRDPWLLYLVCIVIGLVSSPFMGQLLVTVVEGAFDFSISTTFAYIALAIIGGISGALIAFWSSERYETAYNGWPWLFMGLLAPVGAALVVAGIMLVIFLVMLVFYIVVAIIALACVCGVCAGG